MKTDSTKLRDLKMQIVAAFVWTGFIGAISFMEAWLKFRAPGVTLPIGLSIGKLVFGALNKVEITLALVIMVGIFFEKQFISKRNLFFVIPLVLLMLQTFWLLPALTQRIDIIVAGNFPPKSNNHFYYVIMEGFKLVSLLIYGFKLLGEGLKNNSGYSNQNRLS